MYSIAIQTQYMYCTFEPAPGSHSHQPGRTAGAHILHGARVVHLILGIDRYPRALYTAVYVGVPVSGAVWMLELALISLISLMCSVCGGNASTMNILATIVRDRGEGSHEVARMASIVVMVSPSSLRGQSRPTHPEF